MVRFQNDEVGYERWKTQNPAGFVFNYGKSAEMNKLHKASCWTLMRQTDAGSRTKYEKLCLNDLGSLKIEIALLCGGEWSFCRHCWKLERYR